MLMNSARETGDLIVESVMPGAEFSVIVIGSPLSSLAYVLGSDFWHKKDTDDYIYPNDHTFIFISRSLSEF